MENIKITNSVLVKNLNEFKIINLITDAKFPIKDFYTDMTVSHQNPTFVRRNAVVNKKK